MECTYLSEARNVCFCFSLPCAVPSLSPAHSLPPSLPPSLPHSLTPSLPHSLTPSLPHSLTPSGSRLQDSVLAPLATTQSARSEVPCVAPQQKASLQGSKGAAGPRETHWKLACLEWNGMARGCPPTWVCQGQTWIGGTQRVGGWLRCLFAFAFIVAALWVLVFAVSVVCVVVLFSGLFVTSSREWVLFFFFILFIYCYWSLTAPSFLEPGEGCPLPQTT